MGSFVFTQPVEHSDPFHNVDGPARGEQGVYVPDFDISLGSVQSSLPLAPISKTVSGFHARSVQDDYYNVIHVKPKNKYLGIVVSPIEQRFLVWNAYLDEKSTLEDVEGLSADGVSLKKYGEPKEFNPLEYIELVFEISPEGPSVIEVDLEAVFEDSSKSVQFSMEGTRGVEWTLPPNWSERLEETLRYKTEILRSYNGTEQRVCLRHKPRREFGFTPLLDGRYGLEARRLFSTWHNREFLMPDWIRGVFIEPALRGSLRIELEERPDWLKEDMDVSIVYSLDVRTISQVTGIDGTSVTLKTELPYDFEKGSRIYPAVRGYLGKEISSRQFSSRVGEAGVSFSESFSRGRTETTEPEKTWKGLELFDKKPNWREGPEIDLIHEYESLDSGRNVFKNELLHKAPKDVYKYTYLLESREEVKRIKDFLQRLRGRQKSFYCPVWTSEALELPEGKVGDSGGASLSIADRKELVRLDYDYVYRNLYIRLVTGEILTGQIVGGSGSDDDLHFELDLTWPHDIYREDIKNIYWMPRVRLATDEVTIRWITDHVAEVPLSFQVLEEDL